MLPTMFGHDFLDEIGHYATLVDPNLNEFEVLVERNHICIYLTKGCHAILLWVVGSLYIVFVGLGTFLSFYTWI